LVTAASVQDRDGACPLLALLRECFSSITLVWADGGYAGRLVVWARVVGKLQARGPPSPPAASGFVEGRPGVPETRRTVGEAAGFPLRPFPSAVRAVGPGAISGSSRR
jgi:hypothetical protein